MHVASKRRSISSIDRCENDQYSVFSDDSCRRDSRGDGTVLLERGRAAVKGEIVVLSEEPLERQGALSSSAEYAMTHLPCMSHYLDGISCLGLTVLLCFTYV